MRTVNNIIPERTEVLSVRHEEYVGDKAIPVPRAAVEIGVIYGNTIEITVLDVPKALNLQRQICNAVCEVMGTGLCITEAGYQQQLDKLGVDGARHLDTELNRQEPQGKE